MVTDSRRAKSAVSQMTRTRRKAMPSRYGCGGRPPPRGRVFDAGASNCGLVIRWLLHRVTGLVGVSSTGWAALLYDDETTVSFRRVAILHHVCGACNADGM